MNQTEEHKNRIAYATETYVNNHHDATKVDATIVGANGTATIFNENDGGGARFVHNDGTESFVGVNDGGENGLVAQIYADKYVDGKWQGAKIDVKHNGIYYTVGNKSLAERAVPENEIAVKGDFKTINSQSVLGSGDIGVATSISVNGETYNQVSGTITLPNYPAVLSITVNPELVGNEAHVTGLEVAGTKYKVGTNVQVSTDLPETGDELTKAEADALVAQIMNGKILTDSDGHIFHLETYKPDAVEGELYLVLSSVVNVGPDGSLLGDILARPCRVNASGTLDVEEF